MASVPRPASTAKNTPRRRDNNRLERQAHDEWREHMPDDPRAEYDAIVAELLATSPAKSGAMFGMPCLKINGKAFAGFYQGAMVFKLAGPAHGVALAITGAH